MAALLGALAVGGCLRRPDVRVLVDARLEAPVAELLALYEMRTGGRVSATYASEQRVRVLLATGSQDVALLEATAFDEVPVSSPFPRDAQRVLATDPAGHVFRLGVRGAPASEAGRRLARFLGDQEAAQRLAASGLTPAAADVGVAAPGPR